MKSEMQILNPFIIHNITALKLERPDIDVMLTEHYGQKAEDLIIESLVRVAIRSGRIDPTKHGFVEIGGNHPIATSATYLLEKKYGFQGDIYEANPALIAELKRVRTGSRVYNEAVCPLYMINNGKIEIYISKHSELTSLSSRFIDEWTSFQTSIIDVKEVPAITLDQVFDRQKHQIAFLAIDIEGLDLSIVIGSNISKARPYIVQIEPSNHFIKRNDQQIINHFHSINYELIAMTDVNLIFRDAHNKRSMWHFVSLLRPSWRNFRKKN